MRLINTRHRPYPNTDPNHPRRSRLESIGERTGKNVRSDPNIIAPVPDNSGRIVRDHPWWSTPPVCVCHLSLYDWKYSCLTYCHLRWTYCSWNANRVDSTTWARPKHTLRHATNTKNHFIFMVLTGGDHSFSHFTPRSVMYKMWRYANQNAGIYGIPTPKTFINHLFFKVLGLQ